MNTNEKINVEEIWMDIKGYENLFRVSTYGRVKRIDSQVIVRKPWIETPILKSVKGHLLTPSDNRGYKTVSLTKNNKTDTQPVHRLVAETFILNPLNKRCINHKDCNKANNHINNLEWVTHRENKEHAVLNGIVAKGETQGLSKLNEFQIRVINKIHDIKYMDLARFFNVSSSDISYIKRRLTWRHLLKESELNDRPLNRWKRPILQFNKNGEFIKEHESITNASREFNIKKTAIMNNLTGISKSSGNFV